MKKGKVRFVSNKMHAQIREKSDGRKMLVFVENDTGNCFEVEEVKDALELERAMERYNISIVSRE